MSGQARHTPGPWELKDALMLLQGADRDPEVMANARLIAAAPDLLAAARRGLAVLKATGESVRPGNALGALDAAIAKAEGRS